MRPDPIGLDASQERVVGLDEPIDKRLPAIFRRIDRKVRCARNPGLHGLAGPRLNDLSGIA